jgi:hypothetical protein
MGWPHQPQSGKHRTYIPSVRNFGEQIVSDHAGRLIRINPREPTVPTSWDAGLACTALDGLATIDANLDEGWPGSALCPLEG